MATKSLRWFQVRSRWQCQITPSKESRPTSKLVVKDVILTSLWLFPRFRWNGPSWCTRRNFHITGTCGASRRFSQTGITRACTTAKTWYAIRTSRVETVGVHRYICSAQLCGCSRYVGYTVFASCGGAKLRAAHFWVRAPVWQRCTLRWAWSLQLELSIWPLISHPERRTFLALAWLWRASETKFV